MSPSPQIRRLQPADAVALAVLWHAGAVDGARHEASVLPRVSASGYAAIVGAELASGAVIGWGAFTAEPTPVLVGYLTAQWVDADDLSVKDRYLYAQDLDVGVAHRRQGIASALVAAACAHAHEQGLGRVEVHWLTRDPVADAFWRRQGFVPYVVRGRRDEPAP